MIRTPTLADRTPVRTIVNQNIALMDEPTLSVARVAAIVTDFDVRVHVDDVSLAVDGVMVVAKTPNAWEMKILFVLAGVGVTRFRTAFIDLQRDTALRAIAAKVPLIGSAVKLPMAAGVKLILDAEIAASGWFADTTSQPGFVRYRDTPERFLLGINAVVP